MFWKGYQPTSITITTIDTIIGDTIINSYKCHWVDSLNYPINYGILYMDDTMLHSVLHSNTEAYSYTINEGVYPMPAILTNDTSTTSGYEYHTFGVEWLPHELRYMYDSNVVYRVPDRLIPPGNEFYDWASQIPRSLLPIHPAEADIDNDSISAAFLNAHPNAPGCWDVQVPPGTPPLYHAGHERIDYFKVWNLPADVKVDSYPY